MATSTPATVTSQDGTRIAFDRAGSGPPVILVDGAFMQRGTLAELVAFLAPDLTVVDYDRRGRGESTDTAPYTVERELEDLAALIGAVGGSAALCGFSSGATLALRAAEHGLPVSKLILYEPPIIVDDSRAPAPSDYLSHLEELIASDRRGDAVEWFMTKGVGQSLDEVAGVRAMPLWSGLEAAAHTLPYDAAIVDGFMGGIPLDGERWAKVTTPTIVARGDEAQWAWIGRGSAALAAALANATLVTLEGQGHGVAAEAIGPVVRDFVRGE